MDETAQMLERQRIRLLIERDGESAARAWVERTLRIYREAVDNRHGHASLPQYRSGFEASIETFEAWLDHP